MNGKICSITMGGWRQEGSSDERASVKLGRPPVGAESRVL